MCKNCVKLATEISTGMKKVAFDGFQDAMFLTISDKDKCESFMFAYETIYHDLMKTITIELFDELKDMINEVLRI